MSRKIRYGMVGGGRGAFIGAVHRIAAAIDQQIDLVCGVFSSDPQKSKDSGADLFLLPSRCYGTFEEMIKGEKALPADQRMGFVAIVTPNHMHFPPARMALENGFHVLSDKPATFHLAEAKKLADLVKKTGQLYGLTHNYTGYPLVKQAREMVANGTLGKIRKVVVEYPRGWLATQFEERGRLHRRCRRARRISPGRRHRPESLHHPSLQWRSKGAPYASRRAGGKENNPNIRVYAGMRSINPPQVEQYSLFSTTPNLPRTSFLPT